MNVNVLAICPPKTDEELKKVTPELLASSLAKYSRSNEGIDKILDSIDWENPDASVDRIFKFVDYGHASIGGMTGGIAITVDDCSMYLAYKLFEIAQLVDGQESSTRYITMDPTSLLTAEEIGIPEDFADEWTHLMGESFDLYNYFYDKLDKEATDNPEIVRYPEGVSDVVKGRIRKNYALDRARYFIPMATKTSAAYIMTARCWADVIKQLASIDLKECQLAAENIRKEVAKLAPRMMKHSYPDEASVFHNRRSFSHSATYIAYQGFPTNNCEDKVWVKVDDDFPKFVNGFDDAHFAGKANRYSTVGQNIKRTTVRFAINNIAMAELRDLNRHRSGYKYTDMIPVGFYLPEELEDRRPSDFLERHAKFMQKMCMGHDMYTNPLQMYGYLLGTQVAFEHTMQMDKFVYEVELRTGLGAHFRYADHMEQVSDLFCKLRPQYKQYIEIGTAEPE